MTPRGRHILEMRYAMEHDCSLATARRAVARELALAERDAAARRSQCGTDYTRNRGPERREFGPVNPVLTGDAPWMMRD